MSDWASTLANIRMLHCTRILVGSFEMGLKSREPTIFNSARTGRGDWIGVREPSESRVTSSLLLEFEIN
eukprot:scaffold153779_cov16-Attheya_sp.AAC.1